MLSVFFLLSSPFATALQTCTAAGTSVTETGYYENSVEIITNKKGTHGVFVSTSNTVDPPTVTTGSNASTGTIVTCGDERADALVVYSGITNKITLATADNKGTIETKGTGSRGMVVNVEGAGLAKATNQGSIKTTGGGYVAQGKSSGSDGIFVLTEKSGAEIVNESEGTVETIGTGARGLHAVSEGAGDATVTNKGKVITRGDAFKSRNAYAINASTDTGKASLTNEGIVETYGASARGLNAYSDSGAAEGNNSGKITTAGAGAEGMQISSISGSATVINSGDVTASGKQAVGLYASTTENGTATVTMTGGSVIAGTEDSNDGTGIYASVQTSAANVGAPDSSDDVDIDITVSGVSTVVTGHSAVTDDPDTEINESKGYGIRAVINPVGEKLKDSTGHIKVQITGGATINAARALSFSGGRATIDVNESRVHGAVSFEDFANKMNMQSGLVKGNINFGDKNDTLEIDGGSLITGNIDFGKGEDEFILQVDGSAVRNVEGNITNLETMTKKGAGAAHLGDIEFQGNTSTFNCSSGTCIFSGHIDLGKDGEMSVGETAALVFEFGNIVDNPKDYGQITARVVEFLADNPSIEMVLDPTLTAGQKASTNEALNNDATKLDVFEGGTKVEDKNGMEIALTVTSGGSDVAKIDSKGNPIDKDGEQIREEITVVLATGQKPTPLTTFAPTPVASAGGVTSAGGSGSSDSGLFAAALIGILAAMVLDDDDSSQFTDYVLQNSSTPKSAIHKAILLQPGQTRTWARFNSHRGITPVQGVVVGMDTELGKGLQGSIAVMPNASSSWNKSAQSQSLTDHVSFTGTSYMLRGRWQGDTMFTNASYMHGDFRSNSRFTNTTTIRGSFSGQSDVVQNHLQLEAGAKLNVKDNAVLKPSLSVYGGSVKQGAHTAQSSLLSAEVPAYTQKYRAWKLGIKAKSAKWIESSSGVRWQPQVEFSTHRIHSDEPSGLTLKQTDASGILGFTNQIPIKKMPGKVNMFKTGVKIRKSDNVQIRLDYAGMQFDGEVHHGALASIKWKF